MNHVVAVFDPVVLIQYLDPGFLPLILLQYPNLLF